MAWTEDIYPHAFQIFPAPQQPTTILQQLPAPMMPPGSAPSISPGGHVKDDLIELMMIQNAQMHQIIMNNMSMSALCSSGYSRPPSGPAGWNQTSIRAPRDVLMIEEDEAEIHHHYYQPAWDLNQAMLAYQDHNKPPSAPPHRDRPASPPSSTGAAGIDITPAAGESSHTATHGQ